MSLALTFILNVRYLETSVLRLRFIVFWEEGWDRTVTRLVKFNDRVVR